MRAVLSNSIGGERRTLSRIVIFTAIFGDFDVLRKPSYYHPRFDYICFTDQPRLRSRAWEIRQTQLPFGSPRLMNRWVKMHPHLLLPEYDASIYIDGNVNLTSDPLPLFEKYLSRGVIACPKHPDRDTIYEEVEACIRREKEDPNKLKAQLAFYQKEGMPADWPLTENGVILRLHNEPECVELMTAWWEEVVHRSERDQISLPFVSWRHGVPVTMMTENLRQHPNYFELRPHRQGPIASLWSRIKRDRKKDKFAASVYVVGRAILGLLRVVRPRRQEVVK